MHVMPVTLKPSCARYGKGATLTLVPYAAVMLSTVQLVHAVAATTDHVPNPHGAHAVAPAREKVPAGHGTHDRSARETKLPALHTDWHCGAVPRPTKTVYGPTLVHTVHADAPASE